MSGVSKACCSCVPSPQPAHTDYSDFLKDPACRVQGIQGQGRIPDHQWPEDVYVCNDRAWGRQQLTSEPDVTGPESASKAILLVYGKYSPRTEKH